MSPDGTYALFGSYEENRVRQVILSTAQVTTFVGQISSGYSDGIGTNSLFNLPRGVIISRSGLYAYVSDTINRVIRAITISSRVVSTLAGSAGLSGNANGIGTNSLFQTPYSLAISTDDSYLLVVDYSSNNIRKIIISTKVVSALLGSPSGAAGSSNGIGTNVLFDLPHGISLSPDGSFMIMCDLNAHLIRMVTMSTLEVVTLAGQSYSSGYANGIGTNNKFKNPHGVRVSRDNSYVLVVDSDNNAVRKLILSTLQVTTLVDTMFKYPTNADFSLDGTVAYISDRDNQVIRRLTGKFDYS